MGRLLLGLALAAGSLLGVGCPSVWSNGYVYCRALTIKPGQIVGTLTGFKLLVCYGTVTINANCYAPSGEFATAANGGLLLDANGFDLNFFSNGSGTSALAYARVKQDLVSGDGEMWVNLPAGAGVGTEIFFFYRNASISTDQSNAAAVGALPITAWFHFNNASGATTSIIDWSSNGFTFTSSDLFDNTTAGGLTASPGALTGQIWAAQNFAQPGVNQPQKAILHTLTGLPSSPGTFTVECWVNRRSGTTNDGTELFGWGTNNGAGQRAVLYAASNAIGAEFQNTSALGSLTNDNAWHHLAVVLPTGQTTVGGTQVYIDGVAVSTSYTGGATSLAIQATGVDLTMAVIPGATGSGGYYQGYLDECKIWAVGLSGAFLSAEYNETSNPMAFYDLGAQQTSGSNPGSGPRAIIFR